MKKRILSLLLAFVMLMGSLPLHTFAESADVDNCPYCEETTAEDGTVTHAANCTAAYVYDGTADVGKYVQLIPEIAEGGVDVSSNPANGESMCFYYDEFGEGTIMRITDWYWDPGTTGLWYQVELYSGSFPESTEDWTWPVPAWILQDYTDDTYPYEAGLVFVTPEEPTEPETEAVMQEKTTGSGLAVAVEGVLPKGTELTVQDVTVNAAEFGIADASNILAAVDIKLLTADGMEYQPHTDGGYVQIALDAGAMGLSDGDVVRLHHKHGNTISTDEIVLVVDGKITFFANQFSIYVVENTTQTSGQQIASGSTVTMTVGERKIFYSPGLDRNSYTGRIDDQYDYYRYYVWSAADADNAINYTVHNTDAGYNPNELYGDYDPRVAPWITVEAKKSGTATITIQTTLGRQDLEENPFYVLGSETLTINVVEKDSFHIENDIPESGCLKAVGLEGTPGVTYTWTRSDGKEVQLEALVQAGINVSKDRGGVVAGGTPITYTVRAYDANGNELGTDSYEILYGSEVLNPSFEAPEKISDSWDPIRWGEDGYGYATNGTPGLYWKTTAPGTGNHLGHDIEFGKKGSPHGVVPADGYQFVELNAEGYGALYQDVLTTPGATFSWEFSHTNRPGHTSKMYVVMAASEYARSIINYSDIQSLVNTATATGKTIPNSGEGLEFTHNGRTYRIWYNHAEDAATTADAWERVSGTYIVPEGQYLTRLFFVAAPESGSDTFGNLIDGVTAGEFMDYIVEYYKDNKLVEAHTETGSNQRPNTTVNLQYLNEYLDNYKYPASILVNGRNYPGTLADLQNGLCITDYGTKTGSAVGYEQEIVVQIYFQVPNIIVTKIVDIVGMSADEKNAILKKGGFTADFQLENNDAANGIFTAGVEITKYSSTGALTAEASFKDKDGKYVTVVDYGKTFTVSETSATQISNYKLVTTIKTGNSRDTLTEGNEVRIDNQFEIAYVEVTNTYFPMGHLRVSKFVETGLDNIAINGTQKNQEFTFTVTLNSKIPNSLRGPYNYTIKEYADGAVPTEQDTVVEEGKQIPLSDANALTFKLKHNQYILIEDLPAVAYTITETKADGYQEPNFIHENDSAIIPVGGTADVKCYNTPVFALGDLQLTKTVVDKSVNQNAPKQGFDFTVTLNNVFNSITGEFAVTYSCDATKGTLSGNTYTLIGEANAYQLVHSVTPTFIGDGSCQFTITLYDGLTATIKNLPQCGYSVAEKDYSAQKFGTEYTGETGTLGGEKVNGENPVAAMICTNTYPINTGNLMIQKTMQKEYGPDPMEADTFTFTIEPKSEDVVLEGSYQVQLGSGEPQSVPVNSGKLTVEIPFTNAEMEKVTLEQPQVKTLTIYDLPMGEYTVTETEDTAYDQGERAIMVTVGSEPAQAEFLNTFKRLTGSITIKKDVEGTSAQDTFLFHVRGTDQHTEHIDMDVTVTGAGFVVIRDLPIGTYEVTEDISWSWRYELTKTNVSDSSSNTAVGLGANEVVTVTFTNALKQDKWLDFFANLQNTFKH